MDEDDYFASDDLNDLGEDVFQALEDAAVLASTQRQASQSAPSKPPWSGRAGVPRAQQISTGTDHHQAGNFQNQGKQRDYQQGHQQQQQQQQQQPQRQRRQESGGSQRPWNQHFAAQNHHPQQQFTSEYDTLPTISNTHLHHNYDNQTRVTSVVTVQNIHQVDTAEPDEYGDFDAGAELWDDVQPTAIEPQPQLPGGGLNIEHQGKGDYYYENGDENNGYYDAANGNEDAVMEMGHPEHFQQPLEEAEDVYRMKLKIQEVFMAINSKKGRLKLT